LLVLSRFPRVAPVWLQGNLPEAVLLPNPGKLAY
jgi:hypothetical protein